MTKRTLLEIIEAAKDGRRPTHDECYHAMLALDALSTFTTSALRRVALADPPELARRTLAESDHGRWRRALGTPPSDWIGEENMPGHPSQRRRRAAAKNVARVAMRRLGEDHGGE